VATRKKNSININLDAIKDTYIRDALEAITSFVDDLVAKGLDTDGFVLAKTLQLDSGGAFSSKIFTGDLGASGTDNDEAVLIVDGSIIGAFGYSQFNGTSEWRIMNRGSTTTTISFSNSSSNRLDRLVLVNSGATSNAYRAIVFYTGNDI
jgi:hypothetical protein